mgnify:CR=1 FL=1
MLPFGSTSLILAIIHNLSLLIERINNGWLTNDDVIESVVYDVDYKEMYYKAGRKLLYLFPTI